MFKLAGWLVALSLAVGACGGGAGTTPAPATPTSVAPSPTPISQVAATPTPVTAAPTPQPVSEEPRYGGILDVGSFVSPTATGEFGAVISKPGLSISRNSSLALRNNLFIFDTYDNDELRGDLVTSWSFDQAGTLLTLKLQDGVKWHDGTPFTSRDVAYTLSVALEPPSGYTSSFRGWMAPIIKEIRTTDPLTVVLELKRPSASVLPLFTTDSLVMIPSHLDLDTVSKTGMGTGPFEPRRLERDILLELEKNQEYWDRDSQGRQLPYLDGVRYFHFVGRELGVAALRTGRVKYVSVHDGQLVDHVADTLIREIPGITLDNRVAGMFGPFFKNTPPFDDPRVREAIDLWLDRKEFVDIGSPRGGSFYDAGVLPAEQGGKWGLPPEEIMNRPGYRMVDATGKVVTTVEELNLKRGELRKDPRDRERAKELLAQIGIRSGQVKTEVPTAVFEVTRGGPVFVAQMKGLFGAVWSMKPYPAGPSFGTDISQGRFTVSYSAHSGYGIDEPSVSLHGWLTSGSTPPQVGGWPAEDPNQRKLDQLFSEQDTILDAVKRREVIWDMQRTLLDWRIRPVTMNSEGGGAYWPDVKNPPDAKTAFSNVWRLDRVWLTK